MDLPSGLNRRYASLAALLFTGVWLWVAFDRPYVFPDHTPWNIYSNSPQYTTIDVFDFPPLTSPAIKDICGKTKWNASVVFTCDTATGSFPEVRNAILHCVRYAIAAGGSLVLPGIVLREDCGDTPAGNLTSLDYMFDVRHFRNSLDLSCPQMRVYKSVADIKDKEHAHGPLELLPRTLMRVKSDSSQGYSADWREAFYTWLQQYLPAETKDTVIISLGRSYLHYPIHSDNENVALHLGKMLKIRADARNLATTVLLQLSSKYSLPSDQYSKKRFMSAYLSTAPDPDRVTKEDQDLAKYENQSQLYLGLSTQLNISLIYVASNRGSDIPQFISDAKEKDIQVAAKFDLLKGQDRENLLAMTGQQQEMVDYLVNIHAAKFAGVGYSSFSWNVAFRRQGFGKRVEMSLEEGQLFDDGLSVIYGKSGSHPEFAASMWP